MSSTRDVTTIDWTMECEEKINLPVSHMTITWLTSCTYIYVYSFGKFPIGWSSWNSSTKTNWPQSLTVTLRTTIRSGCGLEWWASLYAVAKCVLRICECLSMHMQAYMQLLQWFLVSHNSVATCSVLIYTIGTAFIDYIEPLASSSL